MARHADAEMTNLSDDEMDRLTPRSLSFMPQSIPASLFYGKMKSLDLR
jgi:hypothetical protein